MNIPSARSLSPKNVRASDGTSFMQHHMRAERASTTSDGSDNLHQSMDGRLIVRTPKQKDISERQAPSPSLRSAGSVH